ncbi:cupin domain-containing protein [Streptosporangium sp. NPDC001559]|uniref:cupin domain-containing protein n=1 Tax=Streptosporangium sp. NPDC001559 TaxID=3366187 RepID=UPI0036E147A4
MNTSPIDMFSLGIHLDDDGTVLPGPRRMTGGSDGWTVAAFHVETDEDVHADHWEMHPTADEAVCVLSGGARLYLRPEDREQRETAITLTAGTVFVVPRGRWHRLELDGPSDLMSITLRRGTLLEKRLG